MNRKLIFFLFLFFPVFVQAQSELINGTIVKLSGETLTVKIKPASDDKLAKGISIYNDTTEEFTKLSGKDIKYFKYENTEYFAKPVDGKPVFMEREIDGPATLYSYHYKEEKGNKKVEVIDYYVEKKESGDIKLMSKKTFKSDMADFYSDNEALAQKINGAYYTFDEKEATVEEYNDWVAQGKPGKTWTKENGNYTKENGQDKTNDESNYVRSKERVSNTVYDGSRFAIDIPLMANYSLISSDPLVAQMGVRNTSGGFGYTVGAGLRWQLNKSMFWRNGAIFKMKRYHSYYGITYEDQNGQNQAGTADEYGNLHYMGFYSNLNMEFGNFILGAGFDLSGVLAYRGDYSLKDNSGSEFYKGAVYNSQGQEYSVVASQNGKNNFNVQFDLNLTLGYKIRIAEGAVNLKPVFTYTVPVVPMFELSQTGIPIGPLMGTGVNGFIINLGLIVDISFPKKPKPKSLLDY